jgi:transposase
MERENQELRKASQELKKESEKLTSRVQRLEVFEEDNSTLRQENSELKEENTDLKSRVAELEARINSNSQNSSKPPSSDGYKKMKPAFPRKKKGKQGGQQGHKGRTLQQVEHPDKTVKHKPGPCDCGHVFRDEELSVVETRQVFDLPQPKLEVIAHELLKGQCPICGKWHKGIAPEGVNAPVQYGKGVKALTTLLNVDYRIPFKKIQILFSDLFGYAINASTVYSNSRQCSERLTNTKTIEIIKSRIIEAITAHADETGIRVEEMLRWLHVATTEFYTYLFVHDKRGRLALESEQSLLDKLTGWLVHDCWGSYFNFKELRHALCGAHILRELEGLIENEQSKWARVFKTFLMHLFEMPLEERIRQRQQIESRYTLICAMGEKAEPPPRKTPGKKGRYKRTKGRNLVERLIREKEAMLAFAFNEEVPFSNNLAERDLRPAKVKLKVSNCFRSFEGAEIYARIASFVSTARKNDKNVFSELCTTFSGYNFITG